MGSFVLILLTLTGLFLIFLILLQRGRGGGLAGALGGAGGQSAFGTKAGDVLTRITIGVALFWVTLACLAIYASAPDVMYAGGSESGKTSAEFSADPADKSETDAEDSEDDEDLTKVGEETQPAAEADGEAAKPPEDKPLEDK